MRRLQWSDSAFSAFDLFVEEMRARSEPRAERASEEIIAASRRVRERPHLGRPSRWPGLREWSVLRWKKILIYRVEMDRVLILAFYDARQDMPPPRA